MPSVLGFSVHGLLLLYARLGFPVLEFQSVCLFLFERLGDSSVFGLAFPGLSFLDL